MRIHPPLIPGTFIVRYNCLSGIHLMFLLWFLLYVLVFLCFALISFLRRCSSRHLGVLTRYLGVLARYLGVLARSPLTTINSWADNGMVAFLDLLGGVSDMSFNNFDWGLASSGRRLFSQFLSFKFWLCLLHVRMHVIVPRRFWPSRLQLRRSLQKRAEFSA